MTASKDWLAEIKRDLERGGDADNWPPAAIRELVAEVERLQRFEAMWEDCRRHRKQAEGRAARYREIVQAMANLLIANDEASPPQGSSL